MKGLYPLFILQGGIQARHNPGAVCESGHQGQVPVYFMNGPLLASNLVADLEGKKKTKGIFIKANGLGGSRKSRQQSGGGKALDVDDPVITGPSYLKEQFPPIAQFPILFVPYQHLMYIGMAIKQGFIALSDHKIYPGIRKMPVKFFNQAGCQYDIADKSCLDNQEFLHSAKMRKAVNKNQSPLTKGV
jgi:hypothetical protein